ncbi:hypothetical protein BH23THE1_BH23THE1_19900 [soil metagenome]
MLFQQLMWGNARLPALAFNPNNDNIHVGDNINLITQAKKFNPNNDNICVANALSDDVSVI